MNRRDILSSLSAASLAAILVRPAYAEVPKLRLFSAGAVKPALSEILPGAERRFGVTLDVTYDVVGALTKRIEAGEVPDLVVLTKPALESLAKAGQLAPEAIRPLASVGVGVAVRDGAPKPDISTTDAFKRAILAARSIVYADPGRGASSGIHVASVFKRLGIDQDVAGKTVLRPGGFVVEAVADGEVELGIHQISEILPVKGVTLVGPLPPDLQNVTSYAAAIGRTAEPKLAADILAFITGPDVRAILSAKGLEPAT